MRTETDTPTTLAVPVSSLRDALTAAHLAVATGNDAVAVPVLGMVQITKTPDQLVFRGTNRYHLLEATVPLEDALADEWQALLASPDVKQILAALPKAPVTAAVGPDGNDGLLVTIKDGADLRLRLQDLDYPKVGGLFPVTTQPVERIRLNTKLLATLAKMPGRGVGYVKFAFNGEDKPVLAEWSDEKTMVGYRYLLMPVRDDG